MFLAERDYSVFWDRTIPLAESYDKVIEVELSIADVVIVLWSRTSVESDWVKAEAEEAASRHRLIPIMLEEAQLPLRFRHLQAADLSKWDYKATTGEIASLLSAIQRMLGVKATPLAPDSDATRSAGRLDGGSPKAPLKLSRAVSASRLTSGPGGVWTTVGGVSIVALLFANGFQAAGLYGAADFFGYLFLIGMAIIVLRLLYLFRRWYMSWGGH